MNVAVPITIYNGSITVEPVRLVAVRDVPELEDYVAVEYTDGSVKPLLVDDIEGGQGILSFDSGRLYMSAADCYSGLHPTTIGETLSGYVYGQFYTNSCLTLPGSNQMITKVRLRVDGVDFITSDSITGNYSSSLQLYRLFITDLSIFEKVE